jgi:hypothetical protein
MHVRAQAGTSKKSMVVYDYHLGSSREFDIDHGVLGFAIDKTRHLIATGGRDMILRFWNPHVPGVPLGELVGHLSPIIHVVSNASRGQMISVDQNEIIKIWHITDQTCMCPPLPLAGCVRGLRAWCDVHVPAFAPCLLCSGAQGMVLQYTCFLAATSVHPHYHASAGALMQSLHLCADLHSVPYCLQASTLLLV